MKADLADLQPIEQGSRRTAIDVYNRLHESIFRGQIKPGAILSQVEVARALNVSRTPVREAMRKLQEAGLLSGEPNLRSRVQTFTPDDIEILYIKRMTMEALGVAITTRERNQAFLTELAETTDALESEAAHAEFATWLELHRSYHRLIVSRVGVAFSADLETLTRHSERYQSAHKGQHLPGWWQRGEQEHRAMFDAIARGDAAQAGELTARHLARTALELLAGLAPEYDTSRLRAGLRFAIAGAAVVTTS